MSSGGSTIDEEDEKGMGVGVGLCVNGLDEDDDCAETLDVVESVDSLLSVLD